MIQVKRAYEPRTSSDGYRILVDRLWPRGLTKASLHADLWLKEVAPSIELRKWFNHDPLKWKTFLKKYAAELRGSDAMQQLKDEVKKHPTLTLVYAAKDEAHNNAVALREMLE